ncbi:uncharacterized protein LOC129228165 [Uloborus diversus]|uniref:uncharacterized protein LOC129228165 n=1 Tax=Uloborus diversus TaxID=327109 RepID=UPI00240A8AFC|nr:uncharacterized protein LOC129228165 [Uloborus diversus]
MAAIACIFHLLVFWIALGDAKNFFKFEDCTRQDGIAQVNRFEINPDPIDLRGDMNVTMNVNVLRDVPLEAKLRTRYYRLHKVFGVTVDIPIPCLLGKFGSCTLPLCEYLKVFRPQVAPFLPNGEDQECPLEAGEYGGEDVPVEIPDMTMVARWIMKGKYRTELKLIDVNDGSELACYKIWVQIR